MGPVTKGLKPMSHARIQKFCVGGKVVVQGRLLEKSLILFDEKGLFGLFGVLVNLFEGVITVFSSLLKAKYRVFYGCIFGKLNVSFSFLMFMKHNGLIPTFFSFSTLLSYSVRNNTKCGFI